MTNPDLSTFLANKFIALSKYQLACADRDAFAAQVRATVKALGECVKRRNDAEAMLARLKFQRHENGVWVNIE
tara:strand:+ start:764 stop:982 length:219 start_codon:yes stop_codon:yes gene_type:complete